VTETHGEYVFLQIKLSSYSHNPTSDTYQNATNGISWRNNNYPLPLHFWPRQ